MFTISITLKSFESHYIEKNALFLKNLLLFLLTKNNTVNINKIDVKQILGLQIPRVFKPEVRGEVGSQKLRTFALQSKDSMRLIQNISTKNLKTFSANKVACFYKPKSALSIALQSKNSHKHTTVFTKEKPFAINVNERCYTREEKNFNEINLPVKQKLFTVLRSVHVHKKSRLQFYFSYYIKKITFKATNIKIMFLIIFLIKNAEFYGVELEISFNHKTT